MDVIYRVTTGHNAGFVFKATSAMQSDDDGGQYGGLIYAYNSNEVRIWAPSQNDIEADNCPSGTQRDTEGMVCV